ncbi:hypothetical protein Lepto7376_3877 [[Leptolyngbya] sp. PCC 7376]|uniref:hypothetical protein n=1 Tax=[Leptolyngbya] sp. PCC 7376 TaxID=111781 RepID=UPI00029F03DC|nr:hypothetical protein [[Leptolyngbya] sp. PCC 7376]AFY40033.1 hypothetical protein Lepto7376_3877 [[Leptolyngbya] sp. PCC 7376]
MDLEELQQQLKVELENNGNDETEPETIEASAELDGNQSAEQKSDDPSDTDSDQLPCPFDDDDDPQESLADELDQLKKSLQEELQPPPPSTDKTTPLEALGEELKKAIEEGLEEEEKESEPRQPPELHDIGMQALDFKALRRKRQSWQDLYDDELSYPKNILNILKRSFVIPEDWLYPLIASYIIFPSAITERVPILQVYGTAGTGKSTLGHLACKVFGVKSRTSNDTEAALRRILNNSRYLYKNTKEYEQNVFLVYEDLDFGVLKQNGELIYRLLKLGYDRSSGYTQFAVSRQKALSSSSSIALKSSALLSHYSTMTLS